MNMVKIHVSVLLTILFIACLYSVCSAKLVSLSLDTSEDKTQPWEITANNLSYNDQYKTYTAEGDVVMKKNGRYLYAKKAIYNEKTGIARVYGDIWFETQGIILVGEEGVFNLNKHTGKIKQGCLFIKANNYHISGDVLEKLSENKYLVDNCNISTCDGSPPDWSVGSSRVEVTVDDYGTAKHSLFHIRKMPVFYVPYVIFPAGGKRKSGFLAPSFGNSGFNGFEVELPFFWAISDQTDATFYQHYMSKRGYMQGLEFRYKATDTSKGTFMFDIMSDRHNKDVNDDNDAEISPYSRSNNTRYWFRGKAEQALPFDVSARADVDFVSDQDYLREFNTNMLGFDARPDLAKRWGRPVEEERSPTRRSALRLSRNAENYSIQVMAAYNQRPEHISDDTTPHPLADLYLNLIPEQFLNLPLFYSLESDYGYVWCDEGAQGHRLSVSPKITFPLWLVGPYVEFEPWMAYSYSAQWYDGAGRGNNYETEKAYDTGIRMATKIERVYDIDTGSVQALKHRIWPVLKYRYHNNQDEHTKKPWSVPDNREGDVNLVTFSLENYFDARMSGKRGGIYYRQWAVFNLVQGYDINEARRHESPDHKKRPFTPLTASFTSNPFSNFDVRANTRWNHYDKEFTSANLSADIKVNRSHGREDYYSIDYVYAKDSAKHLNLQADINLIYGFSAGCSIKKDFREDDNISNSLWVRYQSQCWATILTAENKDQETSFNINFQLKGLGDFQNKH